MIRNIIAIVSITLCVYVSTASAKLPADTVVNVTNNSIDSIGIDTISIAVETIDTVGVDTAKTVSKDVIDLDDDELLQAALASDSVKTVPTMQKLDLIRREHEYKKQTRAAIIMMIFIAAAMATSQSWNPR